MTLSRQPPGMTRGSTRAIIAEIADPDAELAQLTTTLRFVIQPLYGGRLDVDLTRLGRPALARPFARALWRICQIGGSVGSIGSVKQYVYAIVTFFRYLDLHHADLAQVETIAPSHIDGFATWMEACGKHPATRQLQLGRIITCLRTIAQDGIALPVATIDRLTHVCNGPWVRRRPRDAYGGRVTAALREAARTDVLAIHQRLTVDPDVPPPLLVAVYPHALVMYKVMMAEIDRQGWIDAGDSTWRALEARHRERGISGEETLDALHGRRYLLMADIIPVLVLLALDTGIEIECCKTLRADCMKNASKGYVDIEYCKLRSRGAQWKRLRVRDGGATTPGGLIRLILALTSNARRFLATDDLWISYNRKVGLVASIRHPKDQVAHWVTRHDIRDDQGAPLRLILSRLRKTQKAEWYIKTQGQMEQFTVGHTTEVAARHYADIPALRHIHEQTIADALQDALGTALQPRLIAPDEEAAIRANPATADLPMLPEEVKAFLDGEQDLWLASCSGFYRSPFGKTGQPCPVPFWGCLACSNAVITSRKLPALIAFLNFMQAQREVLTAVDWSAKFSSPYHRIAMQVLPAFPETVVSAARSIAAQQADLLYLPPEASAR